MAYSLSRNAKLYVSTSQTISGMSGDNTWEVPILDGFSFSAATATQEIELSEAGATTVARGKRVFTTAIEPVNWSISQYVRPRYTNVTPLQVDAIERVLWAGLANSTVYPTKYTSGGSITQGVATDATGGMIIDFSDSNANELITLSFVFDLGGAWYHVDGVVVDQLELDFSIDAIVTNSWSGFGTSITKITDPVWTTPGTLDSGTTTGDYIQAPTTNLGCIRNKLSTLELLGLETPYSGTYNIPLTGGSITISNNITFLTPESLGVVNRPCGHFTGARSISGNITAYLRDGANETAGLMENLLAYVDTGSADPTQFEMKINVGGAPPSTPFNDRALVQFELPSAHIVIPQINIEDVVSVDIGFSGLPTSTAGVWDEAENNEVIVRYFANEA